jgi:hypothetical protein
MYMHIHINNNVYLRFYTIAIRFYTIAIKLSTVNSQSIVLSAGRSLRDLDALVIHYFT